MDHRTGNTKEQGFNPRINSAACPETYTGKIPNEEVYNDVSDPIELGKKIEEQTPYDEELYQVYDPRLMSATTVQRDFACKTAVSLVDADVIAHSVCRRTPTTTRVS